MADSNSRTETRLRKILHGSIMRNPGPVMMTMIDTLITVLGNVLAYPDNDKYHCLRLSNKRVARRLVSPQGGLDYLYAAGFVKRVREFQEVAVWPHTVSPPGAEVVPGSDADAALAVVQTALLTLTSSRARLQERAAAAAAAAAAEEAAESARIDAVRIAIADDAARRKDAAARAATTRALLHGPASSTTAPAAPATPDSPVPATPDPLVDQ